MNIYGKKNVLYAGRHEAERFYYQYREAIKFEYCINRFEDPYEIDTFHGIPVLDLNPLRIMKEGELLLVGGEGYSDTKNNLIKEGLQEFLHFIPIGMVNRKTVIIHGNCYTTPLKKYLKCISNFNSHFFIYETDPVCFNVEGKIPDEVLQRCDIFIHQNIKTKRFGEGMTDKWIIPRLPSNCKRIVIPNFMTINNGGVFFYPQCNAKNKKERLTIKGMCFYAFQDSYIENCLEDGIDTDEISRRIQEDEVFDKKVIEDNFKDSMSELLEREKGWDIKISDFFIDSFHKKQFFLDAGHPANFVIKEIVLRLLKKLDIFIDSADLSISGEELLGGNEMPVYQCVKRTLGLEWETFEIRKDTDDKLVYGKMSIKEYVEGYIYCFEYAKQYIREYNLSILHEWKKEGKLVLFGTGNWFHDYMQNYGTEVIPDLLMDNDRQKHGTEIYGIKIITPKKLSDKDRIIICSSYRKDMEMQLLKMGVRKYAFYSPENYIEIQE